jgi:hypothetical protein
VVPKAAAPPPHPIEAGSPEAEAVFPRREHGGVRFFNRLVQVRKAIDALETTTSGPVVVRRWHFQHRGRIKAGLEYQIERLQYWLSLIEQHEAAIAARKSKEQKHERGDTAGLRPADQRTEA